MPLCTSQRRRVLGVLGAPRRVRERQRRRNGHPRSPQRIDVPLVFATEQRVRRTGRGTVQRVGWAGIPIQSVRRSKRAAEYVPRRLPEHRYPSRCCDFSRSMATTATGDGHIEVFAAAQLGEPVELFGDGSSRRDHTHVSDAVRAILAAVDAPQAVQSSMLAAERWRG